MDKFIIKRKSESRYVEIFNGLGFAMTDDLRMAKKFDRDEAMRIAIYLRAQMGRGIDSDYIEAVEAPGAWVWAMVSNGASSYFCGFRKNAISNDVATFGRIEDAYVFQDLDAARSSISGYRKLMGWERLGEGEMSIHPYSGDGVCS